MTAAHTTLTITIPIAPDAKTCEGCMRKTDYDHCGDWCEPHAKRLPFDGARLPECLAAERKKVGEYWRVNGEHSLGKFSFPCDTREYARYTAKCRREQGNINVRIVHVTRYRVNATELKRRIDE